VEQSLIFKNKFLAGYAFFAENAFSHEGRAGRISSDHPTPKRVALYEINSTFAEFLLKIFKLQYLAIHGIVFYIIFAAE
jgi:hypothetical protein